jgi:glycosyltransferase involved in cell wall biosynthesis
MTKVDVSVVLNMHREALFLRPTLLSLQACAIEAQQNEIKVELVAVFDRADPATRAVFQSTPLLGFHAVTTLEIDVGSLGLARNAGIQAAHGEFIWTSDGDDLVSRNSIVELVKTAQNYNTSKVAVFLDYLVAFGDQYHVARYVGSEWLTAADFAYQHPYVSRIFINRSVFNSLRYLDLKVTTGFAYEDWDLNTRLFAAGFEFAVAPNTILFYRQRANGLLKESNLVSAKMIPNSDLFEPKKFRASMQLTRTRHTDWSRFIRSRQRLHERNFSRELIASEQLVDFTLEAARMEPEVLLTQIETAFSYCAVPYKPKHWGFYLERFYDLLGDALFTDVLFIPWLKHGGAEKYILQILHQLQKNDENRRLLVVSGQRAVRHDWVRRLPKGSIFIDVFNTFPMLDDAERDTMLVRAVLAVSERDSLLHLKASEFAHRVMDIYGAVLASHFKVVYYRFSDDTHVWRNEYLSNPWAIKFLRRQLPYIDLLISDCHHIVSKDMACLAPSPEKYQVIYAQSTSRISANLKRLVRKRLLWASRVSTEKRPELVGAIAKALNKEYPDMVIEAYGQVEGYYQQQNLFETLGVVYRGGFDGIESLPIENFDAFIYTSSFDGLPNIVLEMLGAGLPVIAPNVGGISEAVIEGETGFLVPNLIDNDALITAYVDAVRRLYDSWNRTWEIAEKGRRLIIERHGESTFQQRVAEVFKLDRRGKEEVL